MKSILFSLIFLLPTFSHAAGSCDNKLQIRNDKSVVVKVTRIGVGAAGSLSCGGAAGAVPRSITVSPPFTIAAGATWTATSFAVPYDCKANYSVQVALSLPTGEKSCETDTVSAASPLVTVSP